MRALLGAIWVRVWSGAIGNKMAANGCKAHKACTQRQAPLEARAIPPYKNGAYNGGYSHFFNH